MRRLETERLILHPFTLDDAGELHRVIYSDIHVSQYYSGKGTLTIPLSHDAIADDTLSGGNNHFYKPCSHRV